MKNALAGFFGFIWSWRHEILVVAIFVTALLLRIHGFQERNYWYNGDYNRDYLIAHHILAYHEFPLVGPEGAFGGVGNSPAYFYFLTLPLLLKDDVVFLGIFNLLLQMGALVLVYFLGRALFGKNTGLAALAIFAVNESIEWQSNFVWQPHIMQPFLLLILLLLFLAYRYKNYLLLLSGIGILFFSTTLHQSVLVIVPIYLGIACFILLAQHRSLRFYAGVAGFCLGVLLLLNTPLLLYFYKHPHSASSFSSSVRTFAALDGKTFSVNLPARAKTLSGVMFFRNPFSVLENYQSDIATMSSASAFSGTSVLYAAFISTAKIITRNIFLFLAAVIGTFWYMLFARSKDRETKILFYILFGTITYFLAVTALVAPERFTERYLTPLFGIATILIAEIACNLFPAARRSWIISTVLILFICLAASSNRLIEATQTALANPIRFFNFAYVPPPFVIPIKNEVLAIKAREGRSDFNFFDIESYRDEREGYGHAAFWVPLEREFGVPLVKVDDNNYRHFSIRKTPDYIFLIANSREMLPASAFNRSQEDTRIISL